MPSSHDGGVGEAAACWPGACACCRAAASAGAAPVSGNLGAGSARDPSGSRRLLCTSPMTKFDHSGVETCLASTNHLFDLFGYGCAVLIGSSLRSTGRVLQEHDNDWRFTLRLCGNPATAMLIFEDAIRRPWYFQCALHASVFSTEVPRTVGICAAPPPPPLPPKKDKNDKNELVQGTAGKTLKSKKCPSKFRFSLFRLFLRYFSSAST